MLQTPIPMSIFMFFLVNLSLWGVVQEVIIQLFTFLTHREQQFWEIFLAIRCKLHLIRLFLSLTTVPTLFTVIYFVLKQGPSNFLSCSGWIQTFGSSCFSFLYMCDFRNGLLILGTSCLIVKNLHIVLIMLKITDKDNNKKE